MERRLRVGYDGARYDLPALQWTQSIFMQPQMMMQDRYFYDPAAAGDVGLPRRRAGLGELGREATAA
jgi:hypothetical protein